MAFLNRFLNDPTFLRKANGWATVFWLLAAIPICVFLTNSVGFLVFVSVYAVVTGHLSSWQAARVEEQAAKQEALEQEKEDRLVKRIDEVTPSPEK